MFKAGIIPDCGQSQTTKPKCQYIACETAVNYIVMHCNILHDTVEYTATHCSSGNKMMPGM